MEGLNHAACSIIQANFGFDFSVGDGYRHSHQLAAMAWFRIRDGKVVRRAFAANVAQNAEGRMEGDSGASATHRR